MSGGPVQLSGMSAETARRRAYLDNAASAPLLPAAGKAMARALEVVGNPHALHGSGRAARRVLEDARESLAADLGARPPEVVFTSGGTEANNLALVGGLRGHRALDPHRRRLVISAVEHPSIDGVRRRWAARTDVLGVDPDGVVEVAGLERALGPDVALVSVMAINNETGTAQPVAALADAARRAGAWSHTDAVQAVGHQRVDFGAWGVDALTLSAHKVGGPVGIGALVLRRERPFAALGFGGGQERRLRSGTMPHALAAGFAAAVGRAVAIADEEEIRLGGLRQHLVSGVLAAIPDAHVNGAPGSPAIVNITLPGTRADDVLLLLDRDGVDASTGSACTAGVHQPSQVLLAMGRTLEVASGSLRFSLGWSTTAADVDRLLAALPGAVAAARLAFH